MGMTDDEGTRIALVACGMLALMLVFYALRDVGALPWQSQIAAWLASW